MSWNRVLVDKPKPPFPLYRKKKRRFEITLTSRGDQIWACGECGVLYTPWGQGDDPKKRASECCLQKYCNCGNKIEQGYSGPNCYKCINSLRENERLRKAQEITEFDGPVYDDHRDQYWSDIDEFIDWASDQIEDGIPEDEWPIPDWIYPCVTKGFARLDAMDLIQNYLEDQHHEDAAEQVEDLEGFQTFLDQWCEKQTLQSWEADFGCKINVRKLLERTS